MTTVGLAALGLAPAVAADLAAALTPRRRPWLRLSITGAASTSAPMGGYGKEDTSGLRAERRLRRRQRPATTGQTGQFVFGIEADAAGPTSARPSRFRGLVSAEDKIRALGTVRAASALPTSRS